MRRARQALDMRLFEKAVREAQEAGSTSVVFNPTIGDPLLDPRFIERVRCISRYPQIKNVGMITTLQWLHLFDLQELFSLNITWISVSTCLSGPETYRQFFGVDLYDQMLTNLKRLLLENARRGNQLEVRIDIKPTNQPVSEVLCHADFNAVLEIVKDAESIVTQVRKNDFYVDDWGGAVRLPPFLKRKPILPRAFNPCRELYWGLVVYSNGNVGACACRDFEADSDLVLGHLSQNHLMELWRGETLAHLRSSWRKYNGVPSICKTCTHYVY
jgi:MoaA/NifB/PqqE/SkfB family radical SAM enzyme